MCYYNVRSVTSKTKDDENFVYHGLFTNNLNKIVVVVLQMICLGVNQLLLLDTMIQYYAHEDGKIMRIRHVIGKNNI